MIQQDSEKIQNSCNSIFIDKYKEKYTKKINVLDNLITDHETGFGKFNVINLEAGFGKSKESNRIIAEYIANSGDRKFLIAKKFNEDVLQTEKEIKEIVAQHYDWGEPEEDFALGIIAENWSEIRKQINLIKKYSVVIITHERYHRLFYDEKIRKVFSENRHTLIVDEQPIEPFFMFSEVIYKEILNKVPGEFLLDKKLTEICDPIFKIINYMKSKTNNIESIKLINKKHLKGNYELIKEFKKLLSNKDNMQNLKDKNIYANDILNFIHGIEIIYNNQCIYSDNRVSAFDKNYWFWMLMLIVWTKSIYCKEIFLNAINKVGF